MAAVEEGGGGEGRAGGEERQSPKVLHGYRGHMQTYTGTRIKETLKV